MCPGRPRHIDEVCVRAGWGTLMKYVPRPGHIDEAFDTVQKTKRWKGEKNTEKRMPEFLCTPMVSHPYLLKDAACLSKSEELRPSPFLYTPVFFRPTY